MDRPRTTARTDGPRSRELIFANLNAEQNPDPSRPIKPRSFRIHEPSSLFHSTNVPVSRSHRTLQRYTVRFQLLSTRHRWLAVTFNSWREAPPQRDFHPPMRALSQAHGRRRLVAEPHLCVPTFLRQAMLRRHRTGLAAAGRRFDAYRVFVGHPGTSGPRPERGYGSASCAK
jgi:hypothetical protein